MYSSEDGLLIIQKEPIHLQGSALELNNEKDVY